MYYVGEYRSLRRPPTTRQKRVGQEQNATPQSEVSRFLSEKKRSISARSPCASRRRLAAVQKQRGPTHKKALCLVWEGVPSVDLRYAAENKRTTKRLHSLTQPTPTRPSVVPLHKCKLKRSTAPACFREDLADWDGTAKGAAAAAKPSMFLQTNLERSHLSLCLCLSLCVSLSLCKRL